MWEKTASLKSAKVSTTHLAEEGRRAAEKSYRNNVPLLDELRKVADAHPEWSDNHLKQLVYAANTHRVRTQSKNMAKTGSEKILFDYVPVEVHELRNGVVKAAAREVYVPCDHYSRSPLSLLKEREDSSTVKIAGEQQPCEAPKFHPLEPHFNRNGLWVDPEENFKAAAAKSEAEQKQLEYDLSMSVHAYRSCQGKTRELLKEALWQGTSLDAVIDLLSYADDPTKTAQWLQEDMRALVDESSQWKFMMEKAASVPFEAASSVPNLELPILVEYNNRIQALGKVAQAKRAADAGAKDLEYSVVLAKAAEVWKEDKDKAQAILDTVASRMQYEDSIKEGSLAGGLVRTGLGGAAGYAGAHAAGRPDLAWEGAAVGAGIGAGFRGVNKQVELANAQRAAKKSVTSIRNSFSGSRALTGAGLGLGGVLAAKNADRSMEQNVPVAHAYTRSLQQQKPANWSQWS